MCKGIGLVLMFLGCISLGVGRAMELREREENAHYLMYILDCLISQVTYSQTTMEDCMYQLSFKVREPFSGCFLEIYEKLRRNPQASMPEIMEKELLELLRGQGISSEMAEAFTGCFCHTGFADKAAMEAVLKGGKRRLSELRSGSLQESRKQGRLAVYLGVFGGMFCVILCL